VSHPLIKVLLENFVEVKETLVQLAVENKSRPSAQLSYHLAITYTGV